MTATHMEHVLQHGFVLGELNKLIRSRPTLNDAKLWRIEFIQERGTARRFVRVFLSPVSLTEPRLVFEILERDRLESTALWEQGTRTRLLEAWQAADHPPKPPPPAPPAEDFPQTTEQLRSALFRPMPLHAAPADSAPLAGETAVLPGAPSNPPPEPQAEEAPPATAPKRARAGRGTKA